MEKNKADAFRSQMTFVVIDAGVNVTVRIENVVNKGAYPRGVKREKVKCQIQGEQACP